MHGFEPDLITLLEYLTLDKKSKSVNNESIESNTEKRKDFKMTNYFNNCKTSEELKATYKELVKKYHPDIFGEKGNDILKEIHNQLEKAIKNIDKKSYNDLYNDSDIEESEEIRAKKEQIAKELFAKYKAFAYQHLFAAYWVNHLRASNHRNPITKHNFTGWNVWQLELKMLLQGYKSTEWSTFAQYKNSKNSIRKGEHGTYITLAIINTKEDEDGEEKTSVYYKGYSVFNKEQTNTNEPKQKQISTVKQIAAKQNTEQKTLNLWQEKYEVVA